MAAKAALPPRRGKATTPAGNGKAAPWLVEARRVLVGGVNSPVRAFRRVGGEPIVAARGRGAILQDVQGRRFVDCVMGWGALILGHAHPEVMRAARLQLLRGPLFGLTTPPEVALARQIADAIPSIEQVRFTPSGTEACMTAIRVARAATGRSKVLSFEGCYHGHSDGLLVRRGSGLATLGLSGSAGVPASIAQETIVIPYNDTGALEEAIGRFGELIACAILEPVAANMGVVPPQPGFLRRVRELTAARGILLIFDEVVTGFRVAYGGAQSALGVTPDLTVLGKIIGGGFPIGAVGGPTRLMARLAPEGDVYHAGTFAGHPMAMAAGLATLQALRRQRPYAALEALGRRLEDGLRRALTHTEPQVQINRFGSMLTVFFGGRRVVSFADAQAADAKRFAAWAGRLRSRGILVPPSPFEALFLSTAHTSAQIDRIVAASG
jgi:glutamate-1-semialdehyde 2,1-aminomutase